MSQFADLLGQPKSKVGRADLMYQFSSDSGVRMFRTSALKAPPGNGVARSAGALVFSAGDLAHRLVGKINQAMIRNGLEPLRTATGPVNVAAAMSTQVGLELVVWLIAPPLHEVLARLVGALAAKWAGPRPGTRHVAYLWGMDQNLSSEQPLIQQLIQSGVPILSAESDGGEAPDSVHLSVLALLCSESALCLGQSGHEEIRTFLESGWRGRVSSFPLGPGLPSWKLGLGMLPREHVPTYRTRDLLITVVTPHEVTVDQYEDFVHFGQSLTLPDQRARVVVVPLPALPESSPRLVLHWWLSRSEVARLGSRNRPPFQLTDIDGVLTCIAIESTNLKEAKRFYGHLLGLRLVCEDENSLEFLLSNSRIRILLRTGVRSPERINLSGSGPEMINAIRCLKANGFKPQDVPPNARARGAFELTSPLPPTYLFRDPDGNAVCLTNHLLGPTAETSVC